MSASAKTSSRAVQRHIQKSDVVGDKCLDRIVAMAAKCFRTPYAALTAAGHDRQWVVSSLGHNVRQNLPDSSPCYEITLRGEPMVIADVSAQDRYSPDAFLTPKIHFFAGAPLILPDGFAIGCLSVVDVEARADEDIDLTLLAELAGIAASQLEMKVVTSMLDPITQLPNRDQFVLDMTELAKQQPGVPAIVALLDIMPPHQIETIMRVLGPAHLDQLMADVALATRRSFETSHRLYQVSPTQFALHPSRDKDLNEMMAELKQQLGHIKQDQLRQVAVTIATGVVPFILGRHPATDILRMANSAAQDAREANVYVRVYSSQHDQNHQRRFTIASSFTTALERSGELFLHYQPRVDLSSGQCGGAEALLRWHHPDLGPISPGEFIPLIDQTVMIHALTDWVLEASLDQLALMRQCFPDFVMSVNVSAHNLREEDFVARLIASLAQRTLPHGALEIEITEGNFILGDSVVMGTLRDLAAADIRIAIDDFGTGYSSLAYLERLPAHTVKLDQSFMHGMAESPRKHALVTATINLCHQLGYRVVAEGVETMAIADLLRTGGCDEAQGYGFSRPMDAETFTQWLAPRYAPIGAPVNAQAVNAQATASLKR